MIVPFMETMMTAITTAAGIPPDQDTVSRGLTFLLALACGLIAANIYYAQPLVGPISAALGLSLSPLCGPTIALTNVSSETPSWSRPSCLSISAIAEGDCRFGPRPHS